jgi:hypothetical protein
MTWGGGVRKQDWVIRPWIVAYIKIFGVELSVFGEVEIFLCHEHSLTEEILVDLLAVGFGDEPLVWLDSSSPGE